MTMCVVYPPPLGLRPIGSPTKGERFSEAT